MLLTERKYRYIITFVDHFTKHVKADALPDQEAVLCANEVLNGFVERNGVSHVIGTD